MRRRSVRCVAVFVSCVLASARASADPIQVTGGQLTNSWFDEFFTFNGRFLPEAGGEPLFLFENAAPTPEPSTLLLVGLGLAAAARARRAAGKPQRG